MKLGRIHKSHKGCETDGSSAALTSTVHVAGGGAVPAGGGCSDAARAGGDQGVAEVGAEAGRGAQERLQRGQEAQLPDQELELSTGLREILQRPYYFIFKASTSVL